MRTGIVLCHVDEEFRFRLHRSSPLSGHFPEPQKLAGQCAKLKCCMNYEVDTYVEAGKRLPSKEITLQTQDAEYYFFKADILAD